MQYMAPEQLEGKEADARTDLFAFGAVLYEMITGRRAFQGKSPASLIASIMSAEPEPLCRLHKLSPPALEYLVKTCLIKSPDERRQAAHDLVLELEWIAGAAPADAALRPRRSLSWRGMATCVALSGLLVAELAYFGRPEYTQSPMTFTIPAPDKNLYADYQAISPDGRFLVFAAMDSYGQRSLWLRPLDSLKSVPIPGTEGASRPFWSPDSHFVGFFADRKMKKVSTHLGSGAPPVQILTDSPAPRGGTWSPDGFIVFAKNLEDGLYRVPASGGEATPITTLDRAKQENSHRWPQFFPDGRHLLYLARSSSPEYQGIYVGTPGSRDWKLLLRSSMNAMVATQSQQRSPIGVFGARHGYLLMMRDRTLLAQPFDLQGMRLLDEPAAISESLTVSSSRADFSVANDSVLAYRTDTAEKMPLRWFDRTGKPMGTGATQGMGPRFSLDGKQVVYGRADAESAGGDVWLEDVTRHVITRLTSHPAYDWMPVWSPDGKSIVFASNRGGVMDLYEKSISGSEPELQILKSEKRKIPTDWSRDGKFIVFQQEDPKTKWDLWLLPMTGERKPLPILQSEFNETVGVLSPDGKWLAYTSDETGSEQVYVQRLAVRPTIGRTDTTSNGKWRISTNGGREPRWRGDGKELFYLNGDRKVMSTSIKMSPSFEAAIPAELFASTDYIYNYDVTPDGRRFLISIQFELIGSDPITIVSKWSQILKR
jgi:Tol biopolymer transport system component